MQNVQVKLEFGHKARMKSKILPDGFTHEWTVFVRGPDGCNIQHFVEKVVFYLHESFPKPRRVVKEPPYQVSESGYAGFLIPVEIYFKQKEEPKKISFNYDLILLMEENQQTTYRLEKVTIQNPSDEFREKLLRGGGIIVGPNGEQIKSQSSSSSKPKPLPSTSSSHPTSVPSAPPPPAPEADSGKKVKDTFVPKVTESNALFETIDAVMKKPKPLKPSEPPAKVRTDVTSSQPGSSSKASSGSNSDATNSRPKNMPIASKPATLSSSSSSSSSSLSKPSKPSATTASTVQSPIVERASFSLADFVKPSDSGSRDAKSSSPSEEGSVKATSHDSDDRLHKKAKHKKHKHEKHGHKRRLSDSDDDEIMPAKSMKIPGSSSAITSGSISVKEKDEKLVASSIDKEKTITAASLSKPKAAKEEHKSGSSGEKKEKSADINLSTSINDSKRPVTSTKPEVTAGKDDKVKSLDKYEKSSSKKPEKDIVESKVKRDDNLLPNSLKPPTSEAVRSPSTTPVKDKANSDASKKSSKPTMPSSSNVQVKLDYTEAKAEKQSKAAEEKSSSISLKIKPPEVERERKKSDSLTSVPAVTKPQMSSKSSVPDVKISNSSARPLTLSDDDDEDDKVSTKSDGKREQHNKPAKLDIGLENAARFATIENAEQESDGEKKKKKKKKHKHKDEVREHDEQPRPKIKIVQLEEPTNKDQSRNTPKRAESSTPGHRDVESSHSAVAHLAAELNRNDDSNAADDNKMMWLPGNQLPSSNSGNLMQNIRGVLDSFSDDVLNQPTTTSAALERTWGDALISSTLEQRSSELWNDASRLSRGRLPSSGSNGRNGLSDEEGGTVPLSRQLDLPPWSSAGLQGPPSASLRQDPFSPPPLALNGMFLSHSLGSDADDSDDFDGLAPNGERFSALVELQRAIMMTNDRSLLLKVIDLIKRTGLYSVSNGHMFDFDLCKLDVNTVNVLRNFIRSA